MSDLTPDGLSRLQSDIAKKLAKKHGTPKADNDNTKLLRRYRILLGAVQKGAQNIRDAEIMAKRLPDNVALESIVVQQLLDLFRTFDDEERLHILVLMHAQGVMSNLSNFTLQ